MRDIGIYSLIRDLCLLAMCVTVMSLQIMFVSALEATICASMWVTISLVECMVMLGIVIHTLSNKNTFFTWIMILPFMINLNVLLDNTVLVTFEYTPSTDTLHICFSHSFRKIL